MFAQIKGNKRCAFTLVEIMIVVLIIGVLLAIAIPNFMQARESARAKACIGNLKRIETAKQQWMMDNKASTFTSTVLSATNTAGLSPIYLEQIPTCPEAGFYSTGTEQTFAICTTTAGGSTVTGASNTPSTPHEIT